MINHFWKQFYTPLQNQKQQNVIIWMSHLKGTSDGFHTAQQDEYC